MIRFTATLEENDLYLHSRTMRPFGRIWRAIVLGTHSCAPGYRLGVIAATSFIVSFILVMIGSVLLALEGWLGFIILGAIALWLLVLVVRAGGPGAARKRASKDFADLPAADRVMTFEADESGFFGVSPNLKSQSNWDGVLALDETEELLLLWLHDNSTHLIPTRVFESPQHKQDFVQFVRSKIAVKRSA